MNSTDQILDYWFPNIPHADRLRMWYSKNPELDREIEQRFGELLKEAIRSNPADHQNSARDLLAYIILIDQFSRNIHRDSAQAFAHDHLALAAAQLAVDSGLDKELNPIERCFAYLPFEHSEELEMQDRSVALYKELLESSETKDKKAMEGNLQYAHAHRDIIVRFGRYPHRNAILGRESTPEELAFLKEPGSRF